tara:strand:+ start:237 stop:356 length:120 start_codon:yes stop_codon:yes gene_type:complete
MNYAWQHNDDVDESDNLKWREVYVSKKCKLARLQKKMAR